MLGKNNDRDGEVGFDGVSERETGEKRKHVMAVEKGVCGGEYGDGGENGRKEGEETNLLASGSSLLINCT